MKSAELVQTAADRFQEGADASFLTCFHESVGVYWEPAVSNRPIVSSRVALAAWLSRLREDRPRLEATITEPEEHAGGAVCELIVVEDDAPGEVWRVTLAVLVADDLIREVRAFWSREAALQWVSHFQ